MAEYIDKDALMQKIDEWDESARNGTNPNCKNGDEYEAAMDICIMVEESPTIDAVPVVRCRECKHGAYSEYYGNVACIAHLWVRGPEYFCADGQRREDGDE